MGLSAAHTVSTDFEGQRLTVCWFCCEAMLWFGVAFLGSVVPKNPPPSLLVEPRSHPAVSQAQGKRGVGV